MVLFNCFRQAGLHNRSDRLSIAKLLGVSYGIVATVAGITTFLSALTTRLMFEAFSTEAGVTDGLSNATLHNVTGTISNNTMFSNVSLPLTNHQLSGSQMYRTVRLWGH